MEFTIREYTENDYAQCVELVNQAWRFDEVFKPQKLSKLAKKIYTRGSLVESTYRTVVEIEGEVVGFLFGINEYEYEYKRKQKLHLGLRASILWKLLTIKASSPSKKELLNAMVHHEKNRAKLIGKRRSEIALFVIRESYQWKGLGKKIWSGFLENCVSSNVEKILVETNKSQASNFYENISFQHLADFDSPLHEFVSPGGQACVYKYVCKS